MLNGETLADGVFNVNPSDGKVNGVKLSLNFYFWSC